MPRPYSPVRVSDFLSLDDDVAIEISEGEASVLQNMYKIRKKLVRRKGTLPIGSADLSPNQDLNLLWWTKLGAQSAVQPVAQEFLVGVYNTNVVDFFSPLPGSTIQGGAARFTNNDCNAAWVNQDLFIGDGYSENCYVTLDAGLAVSLASASSQYLSCASNSTLQMHGTPFTLAAWVYCTSFGAQRTIMAKWDNTVGNSEYELFVDATGHPNFTILSSGAGSGVADASAISTAAWHFIVGTWDGAAQNLYVDNVLVQTSANVVGVDANTATAFFLGADNGGGSPSHFFNGRIDEPAIWKRALTTAELTSLWNGGNALSYGMTGDPALSSLRTALVSWWDLEETSGTRYDATPTGNNLTDHAGSTSATGIADAGKVKQAMVGPPATACTASADGAGSGTGSYTFVYCFLAASGALSEPSPLSNTVVLSAQQANLTGVAVSTESGVTARYIFATGGSRTDYELVDIVADNTTTSVTVNLDGIINPLSPLIFGNTRFPPCRYLVEHQSRLIGAWCATTEGDKQTVFVSNLIAPWYSPAAPDLTISANGTRAQLQGAAAGEITGLCSHGDFCAIFTGGAGWFLIGTQAADYRLQRFSNHGCVAHRTLQSVRHLLIWLAPDGVYSWNGIMVERISDLVRETIAAMSANDMASAHSFVFYDRYYLMWPGHCLFFDMLNRTWGSHTAWDWRTSTVSTFTATQQQRLYAAQTGNARAWQLETGATDNGTAIPTVWQSRSWEMGMPAREKRVHLVEGKWKPSTGIATVKLYRGGGELIQTFSWDLSTVDSPGDTVTRMLQSAVEQARDELFHLRVECSTIDPDYEMLAMGCQWMLAK